MIMSHILKMYYGIDVDINENGYFQYQGKLYYFAYLKNVQEFLNVYHYYRYLMHQCHLTGFQLVKNHNQDIISQNCALFIYQSASFDYPLYLQNILLPMPLPKIKVIDIKERWIQKIDCVREKVREYAYSFKHDQDIISLIYYYCGIAENSINVLNEILSIDSKATLSLSLALTHTIDNHVYELLNPCMYCISTRPRQIVYLLRSHLLSYEDIQKLLENQYYDVYEMIYLYARVLYPSHFFDEILCSKLSSSDVENYYLYLDEERQMYEEMMKIVSFYVRLPKISWINGENMV